MERNRNIVRLNESQLHNIIAESVKKALKEFKYPTNFSADYDGNDLNYDSVYYQALDVLKKYNNRQPQRWQNIARQMGFRMETLNQEDAELLHDAIEDAMMDCDNDYDTVNEDIDYDSKEKAIDERWNDQFSRTINSINDYFSDVIAPEEDEYGIMTTPISEMRAEYAFCGNKNLIIDYLYQILTNYDMIHRPQIKRAMQKLKKLAAQDNVK